MRLGHVAVGAVVLFFLYALIAGWIPLGGGVSCVRDEAVDRELRTRVSQKAVAFFDAMLKGNALAAYGMTSARLKASTPAEKFDAIVKQTLASGGGPFAALSVEHVFHVERSAGKTGRVYCQEGNDWIAVNAQPNVTQAHLLLKAKTAAHDWALAAWLVENDEKLEVESFHVNVAGIAGRPAAELMRLAGEQDAKGHRFNAYMLMSAASATSYRGADLQLSLKPQADAALAQMKVPAELQGNPPRVWKMGGHDYEVEQATIVGSDTKLGLVIQYRDATWDASEAEGEKRNRALIHAFTTTHASYSEAFGFIVARVLRPGEAEGWGTLFDATGGYQAPAPPPPAAAAEGEAEAAEGGEQALIEGAEASVPEPENLSAN
jgi:hypothetical protein